MYRYLCVGTSLFVFAGGVASLAQTSRLPGRGDPGAVARGAVRSSNERLLSGTSERAFAVVQGNAIDAANRALPHRRLRLRDCRSGRAAAVSVADNLGLFRFTAVDPGTYVVEMLNDRGATAAASDLLNVNAGDTVTAIVKLPFDAVPFARFLGRTVGEAAGILAAAASTGVLASSVTGDDISPR